MLTYAENKYNASFKYAGYIAKNGLEPEQLKAYPASGSRDDGCFTVTGTDDGYKDNYVSVYSEDLFASYVLSGIQELVSETKIKVVAGTATLSLSVIPDDGSAFDGTTLF